MDGFAKQTKELGIEYTVYHGLQYSMLDSYFEMNPNLRFMDNVLDDTVSTWKQNAPGLCVSLSHINLLKYCHDIGDSHVSIFENDVLFHKDFEYYYKNIERLPEDWDFFYYGAVYGYEKSSWVDSTRTILKIQSPTLTAHSYCVSNKAMIRMYNEYHELCKVHNKVFIIDQFLGWCCNSGKYNVYGFLPKLTEQGLFDNKALSYYGVDENTIGDYVVVREPEFERNKYYVDNKKSDYEYLVNK